MMLFETGTLIGILMKLVVTGAYLLVIVFTLWMAIDAGKQDKFWWLMLIIGIPFVGSFVYYWTVKQHAYTKIAPDCEHCTSRVCAAVVAAQIDQAFQKKEEVTQEKPARKRASKKETAEKEMVQENTPTNEIVEDLTSKKEEETL